LLALSSEKGKTNGNDNDKNNPTDSQGLTGHSISVGVALSDRLRLDLCPYANHMAEDAAETTGRLLVAYVGVHFQLGSLGCRRGNKPSKANASQLNRLDIS
jgi:hypothetical protein